MSDEEDDIPAEGDEFQGDIAPQDGEWFTAKGPVGAEPSADGGVGGGEDLASRVDALEQMLAHVMENLFPQDQVDTGTGDLFYVALTKTGGADGNATAAPSYTYSGTVGGVVTAGLVPANRLYTAGRFVDATAGIGRYVGGSLTLVLAFEKKRVASC